MYQCHVLLLLQVTLTTEIFGLKSNITRVQNLYVRKCSMFFVVLSYRITSLETPLWLQVFESLRSSR
jgi:hypothetical protein